MRFSSLLFYFRPLLEEHVSCVLFMGLGFWFTGLGLKEEESGPCPLTNSPETSAVWEPDSRRLLLIFSAF